MGQKNRQRRAAKQRERARKHRDPSKPAGFAPSGTGYEDLRGNENPRGSEDQRGSEDRRGGEDHAIATARLLLSRVLSGLIDGGGSILDRNNFQQCAERHQQAVIDAHFSFVVDHLIEAGWTPLDLYEVLRRKSATPATAHLLDIVAAATARHPAHLVHPRWRAQLELLEAVAPRTGGLSPSVAWAQRSGLEWPTAVGPLIDALAVVCALPKVARVMPVPGERAEQSSNFDGNDGGIDEKVLRRVRALLAKAESTEHAEEADALTAKAQELMTRHSIDRAVADSVQPVRSVPVSRRLWLENPYVDAKALLVEVVATANNCRAIHALRWGFVSVVGHSADLDLAELLVTSLLLQATRAMNQAGPQVDRYGGSRTRSFRQSFLVAYAGRIGERLRESAHATETSYDAGHSGTLVPVLAARRNSVHGKVAELFPDLIERRISASNAAGRGAGRAAADRAQLDVRSSIRTRAG